MDMMTRIAAKTAECNFLLVKSVIVLTRGVPDHIVFGGIGLNHSPTKLVSAPSPLATGAFPFKIGPRPAWMNNPNLNRKSPCHGGCGSCGSSCGTGGTGSAN